MVFEFGGSPCEGYTVKFRFVTEVRSDEATQLTDQRTTTWEDAKGTAFTSSTRSYVDGQLDQEIRGNASAEAGRTVVELVRPEAARHELGPALFPTRHMIDLLQRIERGETFYETTIFDASDAAGRPYRELRIPRHKFAIERNVGPRARTIPVNVGRKKMPQPEPDKLIDNTPQVTLTALAPTTNRRHISPPTLQPSNPLPNIQRRDHTIHPKLPNPPADLARPRHRDRSHEYAARAQRQRGLDGVPRAQSAPPLNVDCRGGCADVAQHIEVSRLADARAVEVDNVQDGSARVRIPCGDFGGRLAEDGRAIELPFPESDAASVDQVDGRIDVHDGCDTCSRKRASSTRPNTPDRSG